MCLLIIIYKYLLYYYILLYLYCSTSWFGRCWPVLLGSSTRVYTQRSYSRAAEAGSSSKPSAGDDGVKLCPVCYNYNCCQYISIGSSFYEYSKRWSIGCGSRRQCRVSGCFTASYTRRGEIFIVTLWRGWLLFFYYVRSRNYKLWRNGNFCKGI